MCGVAAMKARAVQRLATTYLAFKRTPEVSQKQPVYITAIARDHATEHFSSLPDMTSTSVTTTTFSSPYHTTTCAPQSLSSQASGMTRGGDLGRGGVLGRGGASTFFAGALFNSRMSTHPYELFPLPFALYEE